MIGVRIYHGVEYFGGLASPRMFTVDGPVFGVCQKLSKNVQKSKEVEKSQKSQKLAKNVKKCQKVKNCWKKLKDKKKLKNGEK